MEAEREVKKRKSVIFVVCALLVFSAMACAALSPFFINKNKDDCHGSDCNNGSCEYGVNSYQCNCYPGYTGASCQEDIDDCVGIDCNNGSCSDGISSFQCICYPGFSGISCQEVDVATCQGWHDLGYRQDDVFPIDPDGHGSFNVYCELNDTRTDGSAESGWTVIQRRVDNTTDFYREWADYKNGFGDLYDNHWLGLDNLHRLTGSQFAQLHVYLEAFEPNDWAYASYEQFQVANESESYRLDISGYSGNAGSAMNPNGSTAVFHLRGADANGMKFTTKDRDNDYNYGDNDQFSYDNCAVEFVGAWWYRACHTANLNGQYLGGVTDTFGHGIVWYQYKGFYYSLKTSVMKIRHDD